MRRMTFRVDPDVEISRVLRELSDRYQMKRYREEAMAKAERLPTYEKRYEYGCYVFTGKPLSHEDSQSLKSELAGKT